MAAFNNFTIFPCANQSRYSETQGGSPMYSEGDIITCYTNEHCHNVFMTETNDHHSTAGWIFFGAALVFCVDWCCILGFCISSVYGVGIWCVSCLGCIYECKQLNMSCCYCGCFE